MTSRQECEHRAAFIKQWKREHSRLLAVVFTVAVLMIALAATYLEKTDQLHGVAGFFGMIGGPAILFAVWQLFTVVLPNRAYNKKHH